MKTGKKQKWVIGFIIFVISVAFLNSVIFAKEKIDIISNKEIAEKGEEIEITVSTSNSSIASLTLQIYFDINKLEYLDKTKNSNFVQNRVIYTWVDNSGGKAERQSKEIEKFTFKALQDGTSNIVVTGEFYDNNGNKIEIDDGSIQVEVGKKEKEENNNKQEAVVSADNANLKVMRINEEGISPEFQKNIREYYFIANNSIDKLDVTAIPENKNATVNISGNTNLKQGLNTIKIEVLSADKTKKSTYTIHVTKTGKPELANSNLENLAVREAMLFPAFDANITEYEIEVANDIDKLDILAIPERTGASVSIRGNEGLKIGNNLIAINVVAENGITNKKYIIKAHRRNEQEEIKSKEEHESQANQLSAILANETETEKKEEARETKEENNSKMKAIDVATFVLLALVIIGFGIGIIINKMKAKG